MPEKRYIPLGYNPTASRSGDNAPTIFRGSNIFVRGNASSGDVYAECYGGSLDLNESIPSETITGTISFSTASRTVTGVSTDFQNELHLGQALITIAGEVIRVAQINSATSFLTHETPLTVGTGVAAYRLPVLFEMNNLRGTLLTGNALEFDTGAIMAVGSGTLRQNGSVLTSSLTASKQAKIGIYNAAANTYLIQTLGFLTVPVGISIAASAAPAVKTFTDADVNIGTDSANIAAHGFNNGQKVNLTSSIALPIALPTLTDVYIIRVDANNIKFAMSLANTVGTVVPIDISELGGGTHTITPVSKAMPGGDRSLIIAKASTKLGTPSYGNPGVKLKVTLTAGQGIAIALPAMDSNADPTNPHDAWRIYGTRFGGTTADATKAADSGPWYFVRTVTSAELGGTSGGTYYLEYLDAEVDAEPRLATFDNDYPTRAEYIGALGGAPILVSCQGKGTVSYPTGDAPGSALVPFKLGNLAAAPLVFDSGQRNEVPISPPETIIGFYMAAGRLYLLTTNTLQIAAFTENPFSPISTRPFWKSGFKNPYALCFANDRLYGFTNSPIRSPEDGSDANIDREFATPVKEITYAWHSSRTYLAHDPLNECVCYFYSNAYKNAAGFWVSLILPFMSDLQVWSPPIILSSNTHDMVVSGVATVAGHCEFLAGGRDGAGGIAVKTYRFDGGLNVGETVSYSIAFQFSSDGVEYRGKKIKYPRVVGRLHSATLGIHGAEAGDIIDVAALEAGNAGSKTGAIPISDSDTVTTYERFDAEAKDLSEYTVAVFGIWSGLPLDSAGIPQRDQLHKVSVETQVIGGRK